MVTVVGDRLANGQSIGVNQCLQSNNGFFFALMQSNADFVLYWGELGSGTAKWHAAFTPPAGYQLQPPSNSFMLALQDNGNLVLSDEGYTTFWSSSTLIPSQPLADGYPYLLVMQDDSNFCLYRNPNTPESELVWSIGDEVYNGYPVYDPVVSYDVVDPGLWGPNNVVASDPTVIYTQNLNNPLDSPQTVPVAVSSQSITEQAPTWSDPSGLCPPFWVSFKEGSSTDVTVVLSVLQLSPNPPKPAPVTTWSFSIPVTVPANSSVTVQVSATLFTITVPYNVNGQLVSNKGNKVNKVLKGTYTETKHGDFNVTVTSPVPYPPPSS